MAPSREECIASWWTLASVAILLVILRTAAQLNRNGGKLDIPNILIIVAVVLFLTCEIGNTWLVSHRSLFEPENHRDKTEHGLLQIIMEVGFGSITRMLKVIFALSYIYFATLYVLKGVFLSFYFALYRHLSKHMQTALWVLTFYTASGFLATMMLQTFTCMPTHRNWEILNLCTPIYDKGFVLVTSVLNISSDLLILGFSFALLQRISFSQRDLLPFVFIVLVGSVSISAAVARFAELWQEVMPDINPESVADTMLTWTFWCSLEMGLAIVAACLPMFRASWRWLLEMKRGVHEKNRTLSHRRLGDETPPETPGVQGLELHCTGPHPHSSFV